MSAPARTTDASTVFAWIEAAKQALLQSGAFFGHGTDNADDEAAWLVAGALGLPLGGELEDAPVDEHSAARLELLLRQRCQEKMPTAYLLGEAWFAGVPFTVDNRVLIPRSPMAEPIAERFLPWLQQPPQHILDIGTGSGCIAIALAKAFPEARVDATDTGCLELALQNVARHGLEPRVNVIHSDLYHDLGDKRYDLIVANPPYVPTAQIPTLPAEYLHEPKAALDGGEDGLDLVRPIVSEAGKRLSSNGWLVVETGHDSQERVAAAFPRLSPIWLELQNGGDGVWLLPASELQ